MLTILQIMEIYVEKCSSLSIVLSSNLSSSVVLIIKGLRAKRAYIAFLADFHFLQDRANFWQTDLF